MDSSEDDPCRTTEIILVVEYNPNHTSPEALASWLLENITFRSDPPKGFEAICDGYTEDEQGNKDAAMVAAIKAMPTTALLTLGKKVCKDDAVYFYYNQQKPSSYKNRAALEAIIIRVWRDAVEYVEDYEGEPENREIMEGIRQLIGDSVKMHAAR